MLELNYLLWRTLVMTCCRMAMMAVFAALAVGGFLVDAGWAADVADETGPGSAAAERQTLDRQVAELIEQLGAADFSERERAQAELSRLGLEAFDALIEAKKSDDIEIQLRANYLVRSMSVRWYVDGDPVEAIRILKGYGDQSTADRRNRMERLSRLDNQQGVVPLCRLMRFEEKPELSKRAALLVMNIEQPKEEADREALAKKIVETVGTSRRSAANWLRTYAKTMTDAEGTLADWQTLIKAEQETLARQPDQTNREVVRDLFRWNVSLLQRLNRNDEAVAVIRQTIALLDGSAEQVTEIVDWLVEREAWPAVQEVADRFPGSFNDSPLLLYRLAETQLKSGNKELADQTAQRALELKPEALDEHMLVGYRLQERGLFDWAEREYRKVLETAQPGSRTDFRTRFWLSEMLHDLDQEKNAADTLQPLVDLMDRDESAKAQAVNSGRDPEAIYARMRFFRGRQANEEKRHDEARKEYLKALEYDPTDADVLISLYRMPNNQEQANEIKEKIEQATEIYRKEIEEFSESLEGTNVPQEKAIYGAQVAMSCNQFAWLVSNTFGDFDEAVRASHRSIELRPENNAGYLDTLGRCYYAKGDLVNAVKYQSQAAKLDPHTRAIQRQLEQFKKELAAKEAAEAKDGKDADKAKAPAAKKSDGGEADAS